MTQFSEETKSKIIELCKKHKICELSLFGSRARGDNHPDSDYDFLIDFEPEARVSLFEYGRAIVEFEELIGTRVDLIEKAGLKVLIRDSVFAEAKIIYAK